MDTGHERDLFAEYAHLSRKGPEIVTFEKRPDIILLRMKEKIYIYIYQLKEQKRESSAMPQQRPTRGKKIEVVTTFHMAKRFVINNSD